MSDQVWKVDAHQWGPGKSHLYYDSYWGPFLLCRSADPVPPGQFVENGRVDCNTCINKVERRTRKMPAPLWAPMGNTPVKFTDPSHYAGITEASLICPCGCGEIMTHLDEASIVLGRDGGHPLPVGRTLDAGLNLTPTTPAVIDGLPISDRHTIVLSGYCEISGKQIELRFRQHKGTTMVSNWHGELPTSHGEQEEGEPLLLTIEFDPDSIDINSVRKQLSKWEDKGKYSADVRRLLWSIDSAMRLLEETT